MNKNALKILPIGGTTTVQKNMYVYETKDDIVVFDCGIGFPDSDELGVDIIIPDFSYVLKNRKKVRGIVITHGHEDHRGALPYLLKEHKFDVYAIKFVKKLIEGTLEEYQELQDFTVKTINPDKEFKLGDFVIHPYRVNHSIPDTLGFAVDTPAGRVFHNTDFKFDWTPVMDKPFDIKRAACLANHDDGVLAMLSDCLGSTTEGYSYSEKYIYTAFSNILSEAVGKQIIITTISSNISRISQAIEASVEHGRKVVFSGRSLKNTVKAARSMNYLNYPESTFLNEKSAKKHDQSKITYIVSGAYGQENSGLWRLAFNDHNWIKLSENSAVIFSADPIPNVIGNVNKLINQLYTQGSEVYYSEIQDNLHVSGHGSKGDMMLLANIVKPKYYVPIGGTVKHMRAYAQMMTHLGVPKDDIFQLMDGESLIFEKGGVKLGKRIKLRDVYVDGNIVGDVGAIVLDDRAQISNHGMVVVVLGKEKAQVISRGFVYVKKSSEMIAKLESVLFDYYNDIKRGGQKTPEIRRQVEKKAERMIYDETGRNPLIVVTFV